MARMKGLLVGIIGAVGAGCAGVYLIAVAPLKTTLSERDEWLVEVRHPLLGCTTCRGVVCKFEYRNQPVAQPAFSANSVVKSRTFDLYTPVGKFSCFAGDKNWRYWGPALDIGNGSARISDAELLNGHYDLSPEADTTASWAFQRKAGTPQTWCLVIADEKARWCDPLLLDKLNW